MWYRRKRKRTDSLAGTPPPRPASDEPGAAPAAPAASATPGETLPAGEAGGQGPAAG
jgi:hypothetical protein